MLPCSLAVETLRARFLQLVSWALCKRMYCLLEENWEHGAEVFEKSSKCRQLSKQQLGLKPVFQFLTRKAVTRHRLLATAQKKWLWQPNRDFSTLLLIHSEFHCIHLWLSLKNWRSLDNVVSTVIRLQTGWPRNHAIIHGRGRRSCASPVHPVNTADAHLYLMPEVKNDWSYVSTPPIPSWHAQGQL